MWCESDTFPSDLLEIATDAGELKMGPWCRQLHCSIRGKGYKSVLDCAHGDTTGSAIGGAIGATGTTQITPITHPLYTFWGPTALDHHLSYAAALLQVQVNFSAGFDSYTRSLFPVMAAMDKVRPATISLRMAPNFVPLSCLLLVVSHTSYN
jgi:hypothetical protein